MAKILVHLVTGPENPTRASLALLVARTAVSEGHEVQVFLAGDAVALARPETAAAAHGIGTGALAEHWDALSPKPACASSCRECRARRAGLTRASGREWSWPRLRSSSSWPSGRTRP